MSSPTTRKANAPDGLGAAPQDDLEARVRVLEAELAHTIELVEHVVDSQTKLFDAIEALLGDVSKSEADR